METNTDEILKIKENKYTNLNITKVLEKGINKPEKEFFKLENIKKKVYKRSFNLGNFGKYNWLTFSRKKKHFFVCRVLFFVAQWFVR